MKMMLVPDEKGRVDNEYELFGAVYDPRSRFYLGIMHLRQNTGGEVYLLSSRNGFEWTWVNRHRPLLALGERYSYDAVRILPGGLVLHGDKFWIYYQASGLLPDAKTGQLISTKSIALATLPRDRYVGLMAGHFIGRIITRALTFEGTQLFIDAEAPFPNDSSPHCCTWPDAQGIIVRVGLLNHRGEPIPGFTLNDCQPIEKSGFQPVRWSGGSFDNIPEEKEWYTKDIHNWPDIKRRVQICFELRNAALYSFQFQP